MRILSIGNSFSQDAQRYLHALAHAQGDSFKCVNLYIGGCTLERHYNNLLANANAYNLGFNGETTDFFVSIRQALLSDHWDVVTIQQQSSASEHYDTFLPYIDALAAEIRLCAPKAKLYLQQTWAYESDSERLRKLGEGKTHDEMYANVVDSYAKAAAHIGADGVIPGGTAMHLAHKAGLNTYRDTFHASLGLGRLLLAMTWYQTLTGKPIVSTDIELDEPVDASVRAQLLEIVAQAIKA